MARSVTKLTKRIKGEYAVQVSADTYMVYAKGETTVKGIDKIFPGKPKYQYTDNGWTKL